MNFLFSFVMLTVNDIIYTTVYLNLHFVNLHRGIYQEQVINKVELSKSWNLERL